MNARRFAIWALCLDCGTGLTATVVSAAPFHNLGFEDRTETELLPGWSTSRPPERNAFAFQRNVISLDAARMRGCRSTRD